MNTVLPPQEAVATPLTSRPVSPCVRMCTLDDESYCIGCGRHVNEIIAWTRMSAEQQQDVCELSAQRRRGRAVG